MGHRLLRTAVAATVLLGATASAWPAPSTAVARAAIADDAPARPITDPIQGPPPIPSMPTAGGETPPPDVIADPITAGAVCGGWHLQNQYGDRWHTDGVWWEYECTQHTEYFVDDPNPCEGTQCNANCSWGYPWGCYWVIEDTTDHFYWDDVESTVVFYGQAFSNTIDYSFTDAYWWDAPTGQWYSIAARQIITVEKQGAGSGTVTSSPAGIDCGATCSARFDEGTVVTLIATPGGSSAFAGWGGNCAGIETCRVTIDGARWVSAQFDPRLTVSRQGTGTGTVTSSPPGISCGTACQASFASDTFVELTAIPSPASAFVGWSGDCTGTAICVVKMGQNRSVSATFASSTVALAVAKQGAGAGTVISTPAGIDCGTSCQANVASGTAVGLIATPDASSVFAGWSGDCTGTSGCQVTMNQPRSVTAAFVPATPRPDGLIESSSTFAWTGDGIYSLTGAGQTVVTYTARGSTTSFDLAAQNDAQASDALTVKGPGNVSGFTVRYLDGATDVTSSVVQGTYSTGQLAPGAHRVITMMVTVASYVSHGKARSWLVEVNSHGTADRIRATVIAI